MLNDCGFIVYKQQGYSSFEAVKEIRKKFKVKKAGHTGTLDILAEGVLVVCVNNATRLVEYLTAEDKDYIVILRLGYTSETLDRDGEIKKVPIPEDLTDAKIKIAIMSFMGESNQIPPMYSAKKKNGVRLYSLARKGIEIEREPVRIKVSFLRIDKITRYNDCIDVKFAVTVSSGTYIRSLCQDISAKLNTFGMMYDLCRARAGKFSIEQAKKISELTYDDAVPMSKLADIETLEIPLTAVERFMNGGLLKDSDIENTDIDVFSGKNVLIKSKGDIIIGIAQVTNDKYRRILPKKVFKSS